MIRRLWRICTATALAVGIGLAAAQPAIAEPVAQLLANATSDGQRVDIRFSADEGTKGVDLKAQSLRVTMTGEDGKTATPSPEIKSQEASKRYAVIGLDVSRSMDATQWEDAKEAAQLYVREAPTDVLIGLVTFGDPAQPVRLPTSKKEELAREIAKLEQDDRKGTALYQAVVEAGKQIPAGVGGDVILLTDGEAKEEIPPTYSEADAKKAIEEDKLAVVGVDIAPGGQDSMSRLVGENKVVDIGSDFEASLKMIFDQQLQNLDKEVQLSVETPDDLIGQVITLTVSGTTATDIPVSAEQKGIALGAARATAPGAVQAPQVFRPNPLAAAIQSPVVFVGLTALFLSLCMIVAVSTGAVRGTVDEETEVLRRMAIYTLGSRDIRRTTVTEQATGLGNSAIAKGAVGIVSKLASRRNAERALDDQLDAAGIPLRTAEWTVLHAGVALAAAALFALIGAGRPVIILMGVVLGLTLPWMFVMYRRGRRASAFLDQLPDTLQMLAGSLRAGYSLPQAMDTVSRESRAPIQHEFNRALIEARLGVPPEDALEGIAHRTGSKDFGWIVMAIRIQREVGGNLSELLTTVANTLRERQKLRRQVKALSAEGRLSGIILGALPVVFTIYLLLARPSYLDPLIRTPPGLLLLLLGVVLLAIGGAWMARVVKVEV